MNKKIIGALAAASLTAASFGNAFAADGVTVRVNGAAIDFEDQPAVIENDRTLVPVRGVFEAMNAKVEWDDGTKTVTLTSPEGTRVAKLTIGSSTMTTYLYKSLRDADVTEVALDVAPQLMNDRTMLPLRAISEALGGEVEWDEASRTASIERTSVFDAVPEKRLGLSIAQGEAENDGEAVVELSVSNLGAYEGTFIGGVTLGLNYDKTALEYVESGLYNGDAKVENAMGADNPDFTDSRLKTVFITIDEENALKEDGKAFKVKFKKLSDKPSEVSISTSYHSRLGFDTSILLENSEGTVAELAGTDLVIENGSVEVK